MKNSNRFKISAFIVFLTCFQNAFCFLSVDSVYVVDAPFKGKLFENGICHNDSLFTFCRNIEFEIKQIDGEIIKAKVLSGPVCDNGKYARLGRIYCVSKSVLNDASVHPKPSKETKWNHNLGGGVLTIPFKFDRRTFKLYPAGEIGITAGYRLSNKNTEFAMTFNAILGYSRIPLNDLNSIVENEIKSVGGITIGGGVSFKLGNNFLLGLYYGVDFYNSNNTPYSKDWLSFGIGYDFFRFLQEKKKQR